MQLSGGDLFLSRWFRPAAAGRCGKCMCIDVARRRIGVGVVVIVDAPTRPIRGGGRTRWCTCTRPPPTCCTRAPALLDGTAAVAFGYQETRARHRCNWMHRRCTKSDALFGPDTGAGFLVSSYSLPLKFALVISPHSVITNRDFSIKRQKPVWFSSFGIMLKTELYRLYFFLESLYEQIEAVNLSKKTKVISFLLDNSANIKNRQTIVLTRN